MLYKKYPRKRWVSLIFWETFNMDIYSVLKSRKETAMLITYPDKILNMVNCENVVQEKDVYF